MRFFKLETLGHADDPDLLMLESEPDVLGLDAHCAAVGKSIASSWPVDIKFQPDEVSSGARLTSLLGNTFNYLIVEKAMQEVIAQHCPGVPIEYLPLSLLDHRGRVHSTDYWVVNPIGHRDCVDVGASDIQYLRGKVVGIRKLVLDPQKLRDAPALFRLEQKRQTYVVNQSLADALRQGGFTNVPLRELPVSPTR
ncbi:imm11 family protein [Corallococcus macrosporus]|uniref:Immunity MXAN-0049 protein domain-containing protein n=1 Tax=Myxococcus fulvus (strain ATCC BAA-855 / HW-1) TaxID=483219 RepID=F8CFT6_MYXFH|nr:DUF1629 domain-containing protein [Corallococcus macrosporus]AEI64905.1 hypothetical protein LILAB_15000 [Corallococcus macrosporus]